MKKLLVLAVLVALSFSVFAQGSYKKAIAQTKDLKKYDNLVYLGADFSLVRINDVSKTSFSSVYGKKYPPAWIGYLEKELPPNGIVSHSLRFRHFSYNQNDILNQSLAVSPDLIVGGDYEIPADSIIAAVRKYNLDSQSGLGLVLIPELLSKPREKATTWVVFFDISSRQILYKTKVYGKCSHMGYTAHWASGVVEGFRYFLKH